MSCSREMFLHRAISEKWVFVVRISDTCVVGELQWAGLCLPREMEKALVLCFSDMWSAKIFKYMRLEFAFGSLG